jgi:hypothetical protein
MSTFVIRCDVCEVEQELINCKHVDAKEAKCQECGGQTTIVPSICISKIHGYSEENGYSAEEIMYDGSKPRSF